MASTPSSILIIGSGVFGLSTALSLATRPSFSSTKITVLDRSPFPSPDGSSTDTSRIIRADYSDPAYASLAAAGQAIWRADPSSPSSLGGSGRYSESGLVLVANKGEQGEKYVRESYENVLGMVKGSGDEGSVRELKGRKEIDAAVGTGGGSGDWGYINTRSGWADAEEGMKWLRLRVEATNRVSFITDEATSLIFSSRSPSSTLSGTAARKILGAKTTSRGAITADLTILATGAWTPSLIDLRGRAHSTGQVLCYLPLTPAEQASLANMPVLLNMSTGLFIIPPRNNILKIARHAYGLSNPVLIPHPESPHESITVSLPRTARDDPNLWVPAEGERDCRKALREMIPSLGERPFTKSKICWYTDTPNGDFLITYHPDYEGLFLATGGSGHGYKFLPVIGDKIVDCIEGNCPAAFQEKWAWPADPVENVVTEDGSRGGVPGLILEEELMKGNRL
jgi:sarcosine oxidase/L-pipecolate oxidase